MKAVLHPSAPCVRTGGSFLSLQDSSTRVRRVRESVRPGEDRLRVHCCAEDTSTIHDMPAAGQGLPSTRRRLLVRKPGKLRDVVELVTEPMPTLSDGEVAIRVMHVGINGGHDTWQGLNQFIKGESEENYPLGAEGTGVVAAVAADVDSVQVGDAVAVTGTQYNDYAIVNASRVVKVPEATRELTAAALSGMFGCMVVDCSADVQPGQALLVTAGAGAAGSFILQFAKRAGAKVVTTVGAARKAEVAGKLGADVVINHREQDVAARLAEACPEGLDWVVDGVGGAMQDTLIRHMKPGATMLQIGFIAEYPHTGEDSVMQRQSRPTNSETFWNGMQVDLGEGKTLSANIWPKDYARIGECKQKCFELVQSGDVRSLVDEKEFQSLDSVLDAIDYMLSGQAIGKVVVSL